MVWDPCQFGDLLLGQTRLLWRKLRWVIGNLSWLKQISRFCGKLIHVSCKVIFFAILDIWWYKNRSDLSFPSGILVSYVGFEICWVYIISVWKFELVAYGLRSLSTGFDKPVVTEILVSFIWNRIPIT